MNVTFLYALCFIFRFLEYFLLRTDETFWGEAFVHKLMGIVILFIAVKRYGFKFAGIGFTRNNVWRRLSEGSAFGLLVFVPAYLAEVMIAIVQGEFEGFELYVSAYSVHGTMGKQTGLLFFVICILGNMINVMMEEGIFRGLLQKMLEKKYSFAAASAIASGLFGLWHIMAPVRSYYDGTMSWKGFVRYRHRFIYGCKDKYCTDGIICNHIDLVCGCCLTGMRFL